MIIYVCFENLITRKIIFCVIQNVKKKLSKDFDLHIMKLNTYIKSYLPIYFLVEYCLSFEGNFIKL